MVREEKNLRSWWNHPSVLSGLKHFDSVVSSMVCFVSGHRTIYKDHLLRLDISFRTLCRAIVAPPSDTSWSLEWRDIIHNRNIRVQDFVPAAALKPWSRIVCKQHWDLFCYVAHLLCGTLAGTSLGTQNVGLESSRQNSTGRSAKAHVGSKSHSFLPLQTVSQSELAGPKAAPLGRKQKQFKICRSSIMQGENYKIPLH